MDLIITSDSKKAGTPKNRLNSIVHSRLFVPAALLFFTLICFGRTLFSTSQIVPSGGGNDLSLQFVYYREFGFQQLKHGHLALWNPYLFGGAPFLGGWQQALLYPPNWIYLILPLNKAIICEIMLHTFWVGWGMALWAARYRVHPLAALLSGMMAAFGAPHYLHIMAGHLSMLDVLAWIPWLFLAVDSILDKFELKWLLLGILAAAMEILAGHPQSVFNSAIALVFYSTLRLPRVRQPMRKLAALVVIAAVAVLISGPQIVAGLQATSESTRHGGIPYDFAATMSFAPENFLTLLTPDFFGKEAVVSYWGRGYPWEMCLFLGIVGVTLAVYGAVSGAMRRRFIWCAMVVTMLTIALGGHTPLLRWLYNYVPGFNLFRGYAKFVFESGLFISLLAAVGCDRLIRAPFDLRTRRLAISTGVAAGVATGFGIAISSSGANSSTSVLPKLTAMIQSSGESYLPADKYTQTAFLSSAQADTSTSCFIAASVLLALCLLLFAVRIKPKLAYAIACLGILELLIFAFIHTDTLDLATTKMTDQVSQFIAANPGDYRILQGEGERNDVIGSSTGDIWGYDPTMLRRYAEFIFATQLDNPNDAGEYIKFKGAPAIYRMLRFRYALIAQPDGRIKVGELKGALPHVFLAKNWETISGRDAILSKLASPSFDPAATTILETSDIPAPTPTCGSGMARLVTRDSDSLTISADVSQPSLLVITDTYSRFFHATALPGSSQSEYRVLPANYTLMAIPLKPGHHLLRVRYVPDGFVTAVYFSAISALLYIVVVAIYLLRRYSKRLEN